MDFFLTFSGSGSGLNQRFFIEALTGCAKLSDLFTWTVRVDRHGDFCIGQDVVLHCHTAEGQWSLDARIFSCEGAKLCLQPKLAAIGERAGFSLYQGQGLRDFFIEFLLAAGYEAIELVLPECELRADYYLQDDVESDLTFFSRVCAQYEFVFYFYGDRLCLTNHCERVFKEVLVTDDHGLLGDDNHVYDLKIMGDEDKWFLRVKSYLPLLNVGRVLSLKDEMGFSGVYYIGEISHCYDVDVGGGYENEIDLYPVNDGFIFNQTNAAEMPLWEAVVVDSCGDGYDLVLPSSQRASVPIKSKRAGSAAYDMPLVSGARVIIAGLDSEPVTLGGIFNEDFPSPANSEQLGHYFCLAKNNGFWVEPDKSKMYLQAGDAGVYFGHEGDGAGLMLFHKQGAMDFLAGGNIDFNIDGAMQIEAEGDYVINAQGIDVNAKQVEIDSEQTVNLQVQEEIIINADETNFDSESWQLQSVGDIDMNAGDMTLEADGNLIIDAGGDITITGNTRLQVGNCAIDITESEIQFIGDVELRGSSLDFAH